MSIKKTCLMALALASLSFGAGASAEQLSIMTPQSRLGHGVSGGNSVSDNVSVYRTLSSDLPEQITKEIESILLSCTGKSDAVKDVIAYAWVSDWSRRQKLPPSYVIDMKRLKTNSGETKSCAGGPICSKEGCLLMGYTGNKEKVWRRTFAIRVTDFTFAAVKDQNNNVTREIQTLTDLDNCEAAGGLLTKAGCYRHFAWSNIGLTTLAVPQ